MPPFVNDLYRDLRDRRLLIPVAVLLVALLAVPLVLSQPADVQPHPAPPAVEGSAPATEPAVLIDQELGVRDYRKRLEQFKAKNPFKQQFPLGNVSSSDDVDVTDTNLGAGGASSDIASGAPADAGVGTGDASSGSAVSSTGSSDSGASGGGQSADPPKPRPRYYSHRVDVSVGPNGDLSERNGVQVLSPLPTRAKPVVVFLGVTENRAQAFFAVSRDVIAVDGSGKCSPGPANCAYVALERGETATFDYAPDATTYRLNLRDIRTVTIDRPDGKLKSGP